MEMTKQIIGDNFESGGGTMNIATGKATAIQSNHALPSNSPVEELRHLLTQVQQELTALPLPDDVKAEVLNEVDGAAIQAKKTEPDKKKLADKLKNATAALEESAKTIKGAVSLGNLLGQAIIWCGEHWTLWT